VVAVARDTAVAWRGVWKIIGRRIGGNRGGSFDSRLRDDSRLINDNAERGD